MKNKQSKDEVIGYITDVNGKIISELHRQDRILRGNSVDFLKNTQIWEMKNFYKGHVPELKKWMFELSISEKAFLFSVIPYIDYNDCNIKDDNEESVNTDTLSELTGMSRMSIYRIATSLIEKDILFRGRNSRSRLYFVNPWLFCKGNRINKVLKTMFANYKIRIMNDIKWRDLD